MKSAACLLLLPALALAGSDLRPASPAPPPAAAATTLQPVLRLRPEASAAAQAEANRLYARLLDTAGLFTLIGNLKPMTDVAPAEERAAFNPQDMPRLKREYDAATTTVTSDLIHVRVLWGTANRGRAPALFAFRTDLVRNKIRVHAPDFQPEGLQPDSPIQLLMDRLEKKQFVNLSAVQGLLYGFPPYAVEFFCHAHTTGQPTGIGQDRQGITIPSHHARSGFVYVIPIQNEPAAEDRAIQRQAAEILAEYRERRPRYLQPDGRLDAIRLINDWYRDGADGKTPIRFDAPRQDPETSRRGSRPAAALSRTASVQIDPSGGVGPHGGNRTIAEYHVQAEAGNALAQFRLGGIYAYGRGVPADLVQAARYYRLAAERGMVRAQVFLALAYLHGRGVAQDPNEGLKWLRQAAEKGDSGAYYYLGQLHDQGTVVPRDATVAADWYRLAAADTKDTMTVMPQFNLGRMYAAGDGVPTDLPQAARWYRIAAERGYRAAQRALGTMYLDGVGVPRDAAEGLAWIMVAGEGSGNQAARQGQKELENGLPPAVVARAQQRSRELVAEVQRNRRGSPSPPDP